jgi:hypothetical protein
VTFCTTTIPDFSSAQLDAIDRKAGAAEEEEAQRKSAMRAAPNRPAHEIRNTSFVVEEWCLL